jgi:hypothetical protein
MFPIFSHSPHAPRPPKSTFPFATFYHLHNYDIKLTLWLSLLNKIHITLVDRLCGLVVRVLGYRSGGPGSILGTTRKKSSGSGTGSTQPREYN